MQHTTTRTQIAAEEGDAGMLGLLLGNGARTQNSRAVCNAAAKGHLDVVRLLIHHGCFHLSDKKSRPLQPAVRSGNVEVVRLLLEHGAKPRVHHVRDALRSVKPSMEMLSLLAPGIGSRIDAAQSFDLLTSPGASSGGEEVCRLLVNRGVDINAQTQVPPDPRPQTPLHFAVMTNDMGLARSLLACGAAADVRPRDNKMTALGLARQLGRHEIAQVIVKHQLATRPAKATGLLDLTATETATTSGKRKSRGEDDDGDDHAKEQNVEPSSNKKAKKKKKKKRRKKTKATS
ncbi:ankyrin repeat-containing protein [Acanthamoeba castellanii str. Neff]|uniref:Ankyrin repeat-containing protein n=1 Tax=Acanthamoeba castellanii (strain ATCC 30010 / Neff) TaxID=1257118 RepID=L8H5P8_ACACF|nr:ankyrin repeat-containing protein [Acanthamoeba castellanii str. Neff]ELR19791.1 ankyrin repeat-containing protein [Acanthamoeba castellanii str. Neff]